MTKRNDLVDLSDQHPLWHSEWRTPLRVGLFETKGGGLLHQKLKALASDGRTSWSFVLNLCESSSTGWLTQQHRIWQETAPSINSRITKALFVTDLRQSDLSVSVLDVHRSLSSCYPSRKKWTRTFDWIFNFESTMADSNWAKMFPTVKGKFLSNKHACSYSRKTWQKHRSNLVKIRLTQLAPWQWWPQNRNVGCTHMWGTYQNNASRLRCESHGAGTGQRSTQGLLSWCLTLLFIRYGKTILFPSDLFSPLLQVFSCVTIFFSR